MDAKNLVWLARAIGAAAVAVAVYLPPSKTQAILAAVGAAIEGWTLRFPGDVRPATTPPMR
jgi:hypothetical protein